MSVWGSGLIPSADNVARVAIETAIGKAFDPARWSGKGARMRGSEMVLQAWELAKVGKVLRMRDIIENARTWLRSEASTEAQQMLQKDNSGDKDWERMSAVELLFLMVKDGAVEDTLTNEKDRKLLGKCLNYAILAEKKQGGWMRSTSTDVSTAMKSKTSEEKLLESKMWDAWAIVYFAVQFAKSKNLEWRETRVGDAVSDFDENYDRDNYDAKIAKEDRTWLLEFQEKFPNAAPNLRRNIKEVLENGACMDVEEVLDTTVNRVVQSAWDQLTSTENVTKTMQRMSEVPSTLTRKVLEEMEKEVSVANMAQVSTSSVATVLMEGALMREADKYVPKPMQGAAHAALLGLAPALWASSNKGVSTLRGLYASMVRWR